MNVDASKRLPVTVIIPAYNSESTLARAFSSVAAQTYLPSEIIIVDDASTDATRDIIKNLCAENPKVPVRSIRLTENQGAASARNAGLELATQAFVAFLDSDDAWHPSKLEVQHRWLASHPNVALCGHRYSVISQQWHIPEIQPGEVPVRYYDLKDFLLTNRISTPTVMLRRCGSERFERGKRYSEDYLLWMEIVASRGPAAFIDLPLAFLFKASYGAEGLSSDIWSMHLGEGDSFLRLRQQRIIGPVTWLMVSAWGWMKFFKRIFHYLALSMKSYLVNRPQKMI